MLFRILGVAGGLTLFLLVLLHKGLPVLFFLKAVPAFLVIFFALSLIYAGLSKDNPS